MREVADELAVAGFFLQACIALMKMPHLPLSKPSNYSSQANGNYLAIRAQSFELDAVDEGDDSSEEELWIPLGIHFTDGREYPPWKAHSISSFKWICKLAEVLDQLLLNVYNPLMRVTQTQLLECLESQKKALRQWWKELPNFLRIDPANMPIYCPPSHIVTLKYSPSLEIGSCRNCEADVT